MIRRSSKSGRVNEAAEHESLFVVVRLVIRADEVIARVMIVCLKLGISEEKGKGKEFSREQGKKMCFRKGDLLTKTRRLIKGNVIKKPVWFDAVSSNPPQSIRVTDGRPPTLQFREDKLIQSYFARHPEAQCEAFELNSFEAPVARRYAWQVLELLDQGFSKDWARDIVEANLLAEEKAKRRREVQEGRQSRKTVIEEVQDEEWSYMANGLHNMEPTSRGRA